MSEKNLKTEETKKKKSSVGIFTVSAVFSFLATVATVLYTVFLVVVAQGIIESNIESNLGTGIAIVFGLVFCIIFGIASLVLSLVGFLTAIKSSKISEGKLCVASKIIIAVNVFYVFAVTLSFIIINFFI